ncbi:MAG: PEGA domain-containing protein [Pirellulaceae bacterium]|nr:PEGA domain-containing protein [Pirellulaceae bacterium]
MFGADRREETIRPAVKAGLVLIATALTVGCFSGCLHRRMTIRTNPPGALLYVDDYEIGTTPVSTSFTYYGKRKIRLVKDGYETLTVIQDIPPPWYEYPVLDFITENFVPGHIRDQRVLDYQLRPQTIVPTDQLLSRAENLRRGIHSSTGTASQLSGPEPVPAPRGVGGQTVPSLPPR